MNKFLIPCNHRAKNKIFSCNDIIKKMIRRDYQFLVNCAESNDRSCETLKLTISSKNFNPLTSNPFDTTAISNIEFLIINKLQSHHRQIKKKKKIKKYSKFHSPPTLFNTMFNVGRYIKRQPFRMPDNLDSCSRFVARKTGREKGIWRWRCLSAQ